MDESDRSEATAQRDHAPTVIKAVAVGHRERDDDPADYRVDLVDLRTLTTVASLAPDVAVTLARNLCEAAGVARAQAQLLAALER